MYPNYYAQNPLEHGHPFASVQVWTPDAIAKVNDLLDKYDTIQVDKYAGRFHVWFVNEDDCDEFQAECADIIDEE